MPENIKICAREDCERPVHARSAAHCSNAHYKYDWQVASDAAKKAAAILAAIPQTCMREGCMNVFVGGRSDKKYCGTNCAHAVFYSNNTVKYAFSQKAYYEKNRPRILARNTAYRESHPEAAALRSSTYRATHRDEAAKRVKAWRDRNPAWSSALKMARKARIRAATPYPVPASSIAARINYFGGMCWMCGSPANSIDHVKPITAGGLHMPSNIRPACMPCNMRKSGTWGGVRMLEKLLISRRS